MSAVASVALKSLNGIVTTAIQLASPVTYALRFHAMRAYTTIWHLSRRTCLGLELGLLHRQHHLVRLGERRAVGEADAGNAVHPRRLGHVEQVACDGDACRGGQPVDAVGMAALGIKQQHALV